jgi:UDP:flavonoid glycosyltransferase YjiC (YdhE family)
MKLVTITYGTEGDTRPLAALSRALLDAGHETTLLADGTTLGSARALGVPHQALAGDIRGTLQPGTGIASVLDQTNPNATAQALARIANENALAWARQTLEVAKDCDALIVAGLAAFVGLSVAEALRIPVMGAGMFPLTPTSAFPSPFLPPRRVPRWLNRFSHRLVTELLWRAFRKATNEARVQVCGLAPRKKSWIDHPMLYGISLSLLPRPADWPSNAHMCGQWVMPAREWDAPQPLLDFLAAGEPPIYVGFGSMVGFAQRELLDAIVQAVAGRRAVFYPGWSGAQSLALPANFFVLGDTPHDWLFPRMSMVIHHGGSGTTHSACRAGVPSIVLPFAGDQPFWAEQVRLRGVAPETPGARHITADSLTRAIETASKPEMRNRAAALGASMQQEDGLGAAVATITAYLASAST